MVKRILLSIVMLMLIAYLGIAITAFNRKPADQTCRDMELVIKDTAYAGFITKEELKGILQQKGIYPIGKKMERISTKSLERELSKHPLIDEAECYKTPSGKVLIEIARTGIKVWLEDSCDFLVFVKLPHRQYTLLDF